MDGDNEEEEGPLFSFSASFEGAGAGGSCSGGVGACEGALRAGETGTLAAWSTMGRTERAPPLAAMAARSWLKIIA